MSGHGELIKEKHHVKRLSLLLSSTALPSLVVHQTGTHSFGTTSLGGLRNKFVQEPLDLGFIVLEFEDFSIGTRIVAHLIFTGRKDVESRITSNGNNGIEGFVVLLFRAYGFHIIRALLDGFGPGRTLSLVRDTLVLNDDDFLGNPILYIC